MYVWRLVLLVSLEVDGSAHTFDLVTGQEEVLPLSCDVSDITAVVVKVHLDVGELQFTDTQVATQCFASGS